MADDDVSERLAAIERRLDRLEAMLAMATPRQLPVVPLSRPPSVERPTAPLPVTPLSPQPSLEQAIGLRWAGWVGAIVLVIGAGLGIDFAYRQGWFAIVSPAVRVAGLVAVGLGLIGAGEVVYRRVNVRSAVGLFAAGVAVLFLAAFAGYAFYDLYGRGTAFVLMAVNTVVGAGVARRGDLVSIAVLSILGGNLAPALLHAGSPEPVGFLTYLLTLQVIAVALAFRGGAKWWTLRGLSLATTFLWVATVIGLPEFAGGVTATFLIVSAALFHAERIVSARSGADAAGSIAFGACVTAALTAGLLFLSRNASTSFRTAEVLAVAAVVGGLAASCGRSIKPGLRAVAAGFLGQAIALVVLAVPVAVSGGSVVIGWGLLAGMLAACGWWSAPAAYAGPLVWVLATFDLLLWAKGVVGDGLAQGTWATVAGQAVPAYVVVAWLLTVDGHAIAAVTRRNGRVNDRSEVAFGLDGAAAVVWASASIAGLATSAATTAVLVHAAAVTAAGLAGAMPVSVGTAVAVFAAVKWMGVDAGLDRPADGSTWSAAALGLAVVAELAAVSWANRRQVRVGRQVLRAFTVVAGVWAGSVVVDAAFATAHGRRPTEPALAEQVALSVLWAASAAAAVAAGFGRRLPDLRYVGLGLFAVTLVKVVAVDLAGVAAGWRVLSFLGLGGLLLATSVLYGRLGGAAGTVPRE